MDTRINYYGLQVALERNCLPESAFAKLFKLPEPDYGNLTDLAAIRLFREEEKLPWKEIAELYGVSEATVWRLVNRRTKYARAM